MRFSSITFLIFMINGALDTGNYDAVTMREAKEHVERGDLFEWLKSTIEDADLSLFSAEQLREINSVLQDVAGGLDGREMRKVSVERRGFCYLVALLVEVLQHHVEYPANKPAR